MGELGVEKDFLSELAQSCLDVTRGCIRVSCENVTPVTLAVHSESLLAQLDEGSEYGLVTVGVELHGLADDVGNLGVFAVVDSPHCVQNSALHRLEPVHNVGHSPVQDHVRGVIQIPVLEHSGQLETMLVCLQHMVKALGLFGLDEFFAFLFCYDSFFVFHIRTPCLSP